MLKIFFQLVYALRRSLGLYEIGLVRIPVEKDY